MKDKNKIVILMLAFAFAIVVFTTQAQAEVVSPVGLTEGTSETRDLSSLPTQSVEAQGGNLTAVNIDVLTITNSWQGYYGNVTGEITLDDGNNNTFYNWSVAAPSGQVYGTRTAGVDFSTVGCSSVAQNVAEESTLSQTATDGDSLRNTFTQNNHPQFTVAGATINTNTCNSTNAYVSGAQDTAEFYQVLLADGSSNFVYGTIMEDDQTSFDGATADFQLLVGEDEAAGSTTYFFFVELT